MQVKCLVLMSLLVVGVAQMSRAQNRFLVPVYLKTEIPGAQGSLWQSQFAVHNASVHVYTFVTCAVMGPHDGCPADVRDDELLNPNDTKTVLPSRYPSPANGIAGAIIYIYSNDAPKEDVSGLSFDLRVRDISRSATAAGTEIPVVRDSDLRTTTINLLNIPVDARFRASLRLFEVNMDQADFAVRVYDQASNALLIQTTLHTATSAQGNPRFTPGFAELDNLLSTAGSSGALRVEIQPETTGAAFWSYVSITNNDSQQITLVTPQ